jgi:hypothetical protein
MRTFRTFAGFAMLAAAFLLGGCASVPMGDASQDAALKSFPAPKPGMAGVYIYRNEVFGAAIKLPLVLDGASVGQSGPKTYFYADVAPGQHTVVSQSENTDTLSFNAAAGKLYFVWQEVKMGLFAARSKLHLVADGEGRKGVQESVLAASSLPPARTQPVATAPGIAAAPALGRAQATAAPAAPAAPGRYSGRWSGAYRCGAYAGVAPTSNPGPWSMQVNLVVDGNRAMLRRAGADYSEDLQGVVAADGSLALIGQGAMAKSINLPWTTRFQGKFGGSQERFEASGNMTGIDGVVFRACNLELVRAAAY